MKDSLQVYNVHNPLQPSVKSVNPIKTHIEDIIEERVKDNNKYNIELLPIKEYVTKIEDMARNEDKEKLKNINSRIMIM